MKSVPSKIQPTLLRYLNEQQVLTALQRQGPLSRADLSRATGVSFPTVTRAVAALVEAQLLEEEDEVQPSSIGRPSRLVRLARTRVSVLACVLGTQTCELVASALDGEVVDGSLRTFATPATYAALLARCVDEGRELLAESPTTVLSLGVSVPGLLNRREGRSLVSPNLHQLDGHSLGADLQERLQLDTTIVQECHALCLAEQTFGAARGIDDFAMLDISEGLGLGVMHRGELLVGHNGLAGELGHVTVELNGRRCGCGNRGCLETVATDSALLALVQERTGQRWEIDELLAAVQSGRLDVQAELEHVLAYLAVGVAAVLNVFNPHRLFIFGRFLDARADLFPRLLELVAERALAPNRADCEIVRARGNKRLGAVAAAIQGARRARHDSGQ